MTKCIEELESEAATDLSFLVTLSFTPQYRVVEQVVGISVKHAVERG